MEDARPEPRRTSENDQPMTAAMGNDAHHPLPNFNNTATPTTGHQAPPPQTGVKKTKATLKIATLNIRGGGSQATRGKWQHVNQIMRDKEIAVLAIQETHLDEQSTNELNNNFHYRMRIINSADPQNPTAGKGVAIVLNKHLTKWNEVKICIIIPGRAILLTLPLKKKDSAVNILAIYAPNTPQENVSFWASLTNTWEEVNPPIPDIMLGDFNIVEEALDRFPPHRDNTQAVSNLATFKALHTLQDGWRHHHPDVKSYSFTQEATQSRSWIDRIYVSEPIYTHSRNWDINLTSIKTDHCLTSMEFSDPGAPYIGKGRWSIPLYLVKHRKVLQLAETLGQDLEK
jgi:exonuclease III